MHRQKRIVFIYGGFYKLSEVYNCNKRRAGLDHITSETEAHSVAIRAAKKLNQTLILRYQFYDVGKQLVIPVDVSAGVFRNLQITEADLCITHNLRCI